ncbi:MAG: hypothetical protein QME51_03435, partial [Planctomycetota bacterium]|nr:hypothetical protein [Planctomycetota bacterium]
MPSKTSQVHIPGQPWTRDQVIYALKQRVRQKLSLSARVVEKEFSGLVRAARQIFGSFPKARRATKIKPKQFRLRRVERVWTQRKTIAALRKWYRQHRTTPPSPSSQGYRRLQRLRYHAQKYFPNTNTLRRKLGLPRVHYWSPDLVIKRLRLRIERGQRMNPKTLRKKVRRLYQAARA